MRSCTKKKPWNLRVVEPEFETGNRRGRFKNVFWKVGNLEAYRLKLSVGHY
jgi:hypothetical protein